MTRKTYFSLIATCMATAMQAQSPRAFIIEGKIPGLQAGCKVELVSTEFGHRDLIAATTSTDGAFRLEGDMESPTLCWIDIENKDEEIPKQFDLMIESGTTRIEVPHCDSLPPSFSVTTEKLEKERYVTISGGQTQQEFAAYRAAMRPYELAAKNIHYNMYWSPEADRADKARTDSLQTLLDRADRAVADAQLDFITRHPDYAISAYLWCYLLRDPFSFTNEELDRIQAQTSGNRDTKRLVRLRQAIEDSRKHVKGVKYTDLDALDTDKNECRLSSYIRPGRYAFIDFWASWCGPCRAAIPHVRGMYKKYADRMDVCSVSLDSKEDDWRKAMNDEKMEWTQLWLPKEKQKAAMEAYSIHGIPFLMLVSPEGEILYAGSSAHDATDILDHHIHE